MQFKYIYMYTKKENKKNKTCSTSKRLQVRAPPNVIVEQNHGRLCHSSSRYWSISQSSVLAEDTHALRAQHSEPFSAPGEGLIPSKSPASHHSRTEVPSPHWVDRLFEAPSVVSGAKLTPPQLLVAARATHGAEGGWVGGAIRRSCPRC